MFKTSLFVCVAALIMGLAIAKAPLTPQAGNARIVKKFKVQNTSSMTLFQTVARLMEGAGASSIDFISYDPTDNSVIARGSEEDLTKLGELVHQCDVPPLKIQLDVKVELKSVGLVEDMSLRVHNGSTISLDDKPNALSLALDLRVEKKDEVQAKLTWLEGKEKRVVEFVLSYKNSRKVVDYAEMAANKSLAPRVIIDFRNIISTKPNK